MPSENSSPLVSVIMATYNRSNVLNYSIQSILNSDFQDWELLVIGDCCTDDTESVVNSFIDKRIRFVNLEKNHGEQSQANNVGLKLSKGKYIAFLNHDDLWFPDHLTTALKGIEETGADLVYTLLASMNTLIGKANTLFNYTPKFIPASSWLFKKTLYETIGDWSYYKDCTLVPSQDWINRVREANKKTQLIPKLTVIAIVSGTRKNVYLNKEWKENEYYFQQIKNNPYFREQVMTDFSGQYAIEKEKRISFLTFFKSNFKAMIFNFGVSPKSIELFKKSVFKKKRGIDHLRKIRGLPPIK